MMNGYVWIISESIIEYGNEITVKFNQLQRCATGSQMCCEGTGTRANFDNGLTTLRIYDLYNTIDNADIMQKILAQPFFCTHQCFFSLLLAQNRASLIAARKLPASAMPLPAISKAVP